jgi:hypothetical protein
MLTLTIISTLFSMVYIFVVYYGWDRYFILKHSSIKKYIPEYSKLCKSDEGCRVVVCLNANKETLKNFKNLDSLKNVIASLLDQTVKVDQISLSIPKSCSDFVPSEYKDCVNIFNCEDNKSNASLGRGSLLPTLLREGEKNTKIIYVKENKIFGKDFVETIVDISNENPNSAIECKDAILVKPKFFSDKVEELNENKQEIISFGDETFWKRILKVPIKEVTYKNFSL